jgi:hypothetical protein
VPTSSRSLFLPLAALVLALDGLAALVLSGTSLLFMNAVAAIEGQTGNPNAHLGWWALGFLVVAVAAFVAAWRAARRARSGRWLGMLVAGATTVMAGSALWAMATASPIDLRGLAVMGAVLLAQVLVLAALAAWAPVEA